MGRVRINYGNTKAVDRRAPRIRGNESIPKIATNRIQSYIIVRRLKRHSVPTIPYSREHVTSARE